MEDIKLVYEERLNKWLEALRSNKYKQAKGILHQIIDQGEKFCCLGVACVLQTNLKKVEWGSTHFKYGNSLLCGSTLPKEAVEYYGMKSDYGDFQTPYIFEENYCLSLISLNDGGCPFNEIADVIEARKSELFHWA